MGNEPSYVKEAKKASTTSQALSIYEKKLQDRIKRKGPDSQAVAEVYKYMGDLMKDGKQYKQAVEYYNKVTEYVERNKESEPKENIGQLYFNMGTCAFYLKEYKDANSYYQKAFEGYKLSNPALVTFFPANFEGVVVEYLDIKQYEFAIYFQQLILKWYIAKYGKFHPDLAKMHDKLGESYSNNEQYDKAIDSLSHSLEIYITTRGEHDLEVANTYEKLGKAYQKQGLSECSIDYYKKALDIKKDLLPKNSLDLAKVYSELGNSHFNKGNYEEASNYFKNAFQLYKDNKGNTEVLADSAMNLAKSNSYRYLYREAIETSKAAKDILKKIPNKEMETAEIDSTTATYFSAIELYDEAIENLSNALETMISRLGENDIKVARIQTRMGIAYIGKGIYKEAHDSFRKALLIYTQKEVLPTDIPDYVDCHCGQASCYREQDQIEEALKAIENAVEVCAELKDDAILSKIFMFKGEILLDIASYEEAIKTFNEVLQLRSKYYLNKSHASIAETYNSIGSAYLAKGLYKEAMAWHMKAFELYKKYYADENHIPIVVTYNKLGEAHLHEGKFDEALKYFTKFAEIWTRLGGADHQNVVQGYQKMADVYSRKGDLEKALEYLKKSFDILGKKTQRMNKHLAKLYANIGIIYKRANQSDNAIKFYTQSMEGYKTLFGENHKDYKQMYDCIEALKSLEEYDFSEDKVEHPDDTASKAEIYPFESLEDFKIKDTPKDESSLFHCLGLALEPHLYEDVEYYIASIRKFTLMTIAENREDLDFVKDMKSTTLEEYLPSLIENKPGTVSDLVGIAKYFKLHFWIFGKESNGEIKIRRVVTGSVPSSRRIILFEYRIGSETYFSYLEAKVKQSDKVTTLFEIEQPELDKTCITLCQSLLGVTKKN